MPSSSPSKLLYDQLRASLEKSLQASIDQGTPLAQSWILIQQNLLSSFTTLLGDKRKKGHIPSLLLPLKPWLKSRATLSVDDAATLHQWLLDWKPGIAQEPSQRLEKRHLQVVVPLSRLPHNTHSYQVLDALPPGTVFLSKIHARKRHGAFYTPRIFAAYLAKRCLQPWIQRLSPRNSPQPLKILSLKAIDPAMGAAIFLLEALSFLAQSLLESCKVALQLSLPERILELPRGDAILASLRNQPEQATLLLARQVIAPRCLFGIDKDPLAVELARSSLALEANIDPSLKPFQDSLVHADSLLEMPNIIDPNGFHAVIGNPPWESFRRNDKEFFSALDPRILDGKTKKERQPLIDALLEDPLVNAQYQRYCQHFKDLDKQYRARYESPRTIVQGRLAGRGTYDLSMLFLERGLSLLTQQGLLGFIMPAAFQNAESYTGLRQGLIDSQELRECLTFNNRQRLFPAVAAGETFDLIVAERGARCKGFSFAPQREDPDWLLLENRRDQTFELPFQAVKDIGGDYYSISNFRSSFELRLLQQLFSENPALKDMARAAAFDCGQEFNMTYDRRRSLSSRDLEASHGDLRAHTQFLRQDFALAPLHEKGTFEAYNDRLKNCPRYLVDLNACSDRQDWLEAFRYERLCIRSTIHAEESSKSVACLLPPGVIVGNSCNVEKHPQNTPRYWSLILCALLNSSLCDWIVARLMRKNLNKFILEQVPIPRTAFEAPNDTFIAHAALRLQANNRSYLQLWNEFLPTPWQALQGTPRTLLIAQLDALVASLYRLNLQAYRQILEASPRPPRFRKTALQAFQIIEQGDLAAFYESNDPFFRSPCYRGESGARFERYV